MIIFLVAIASMYILGHTKQRKRKKQELDDQMIRNNISTNLSTSAVEKLGRHTSQKVKVIF